MSDFDRFQRENPTGSAHTKMVPHRSPMAGPPEEQRGTPLGLNLQAAFSCRKECTPTPIRSQQHSPPSCCCFLLSSQRYRRRDTRGYLLCTYWRRRRRRETGTTSFKFYTREVEVASSTTYQLQQTDSSPRRDEINEAGIGQKTSTTRRCFSSTETTGTCP